MKRQLPKGYSSPYGRIHNAEISTEPPKNVVYPKTKKELRFREADLLADIISKQKEAE